jgi:hypothetical protein
MTNPFAAAIRPLRVIRYELEMRLECDEVKGDDVRLREVNAAIRVLEAAGRVDKEDAIDNLDGLVVCFYGMVVGEKAADIDISRYSNIRPSHGQTRALLSALPEVTK